MGIFLREAYQVEGAVPVVGRSLILAVAHHNLHANKELAGLEKLLLPTLHLLNRSSYLADSAARLSES